MIVGIDIGQESSQICYYDEQQRQPVSVSVVNSVDNRQKYQFGFMLSGANQDNLKELLCTLLALLPKNGRKAGERDSICVTVSDFSKPVLEKLSAAVQLTGYAKENWSFISHEEAYAYYAFSQKKELYVNGAVLLDYREDGLHTHYMTIVKKSGQEMIPEESHVYSSEMICSVPQRRKTLAQAEKELIHCVQDALKDKIGSALQPESIVNNQVTTETGYALDARQANPNLDGTLAKQISDLNGSLGNLKVLTCDSFEALDTELSNMLTNTPYIAVIPGGYGMLFGLKNNSDYQRQLRMTYWDNVLYSRVKTNSTKWSEWVNVNDITKFIDIPSNANLNDIKFFNVGKYRCYSNVTAGTVLNSPFKTAFTMEVYYSAGTSNYVAQKATEFATGHCKWRMRETGSGKLQDWVQLY